MAKSSTANADVRILKVGNVLDGSRAVFLEKEVHDLLNQGITNVTLDFSDTSTFSLFGIAQLVSRLPGFGRDHRIRYFGEQKKIPRIFSALNHSQTGAFFETFHRG